MEKHLLVTISHGKNAAQCLRFLSGYLTDMAELRLTLFYVAPRSVDWKLDRDMTPDEAALDEIETIKRRHGRQTLDEAKQWLVRMREFDPARIETKLAHPSRGTVPEIVEEAHNGLYDAVLLGRRGLSWVEQMFEDSVSHKMLWEDIDFPLWVCRMHQKDFPHRLLLCADGSEESARVADHAGFMLRGEPHEVTLLHVDGATDASEACRDADTCFSMAREALLETGFPAERIHEKSITATNAARAVAREAREGGYGAVAVGRRSSHEPSALKLVFPGSTSVSLLRELHDIALWISK